MNLRSWLAIGLLSASWLPGLGYYAPANVWVWAILVLAGAGLLWGSVMTLPGRRAGTVALVLMLPVLWFAPWPQKAVPILLAVGLAAAVAPAPGERLRRLASASIAAGGVLAAQAAAMYLYEVMTARSHDLPRPLAAAVAAVARLFGADVGVSDATVSIRETTTVHSLGATWDLLLPPTVVCFMVGAMAMLALRFAGRPRPRRAWLAALGMSALVILAWLPIQWALALGLYAQRVALTDPTIPLCVMNQFVTWWLPAVLLAGPVLLAWWFVPGRSNGAASGDKPQLKAAAETAPRRTWIAMALAAAGAALVTFPWAWDPIGSPKQGRIRVAERCSEWEPTDAAYDENTYGEKASYTYRVLYDYASHYFTMSRIGRTTPITADSLDGCDVLVLKTPTARMTSKEVDAIVNFVEHGGGLLMIGDHTNVFRSTTYLNDVARRLGFTLRNDLLFRVGTPYEEPYRAAAVAHPAVMNVGPLDFAVSCSVDPGWSWGRSAFGGRGLWNLQSQYEVENYHPPAEYRAEMRHGPFVQIWAARHGKGRVLAFTDSTIFSNFCIFQPGKSELMLNMLSWLNHRSPMDVRGRWLTVVVPVGLVGLALLAAGAWLARQTEAGWTLMLSAVLAGGVACSAVVTGLAAAAMPAPESKDGKAPFLYVIDRGISRVPLSKGAFIQGDGAGYGLLEQWITRVNRPADPAGTATGPVGYTARRSGDAVFSGDVLVVICPTGSVSEAYRDRLFEFVRDGGRLVVLDAPSNVESKANDLLWPFGLSMDPGPQGPASLRMLDRPTGVQVEESCRVSGGTPIAAAEPQTAGSSAPPPAGAVPVAAEAKVGKGTVTAVGFATAFNDAAMGREWLREPNDAMRQRYEVLYAILRHVVRPSR